MGEVCGNMQRNVLRNVQPASSRYRLHAEC